MILNFHMQSGATLSVHGVKKYKIKHTGSPSPVSGIEVTFYENTIATTLIPTIDLSRVEGVSVIYDADDRLAEKLSNA